MENLPLEIAIVGGGGTLVATHLLRSASQSITLHLIEPRPGLGRGIADRTDYRCHLFNVPAGKMSAFPEEPDDFLCWMVTRKDPSVQADSFVPVQFILFYTLGSPRKGGLGETTAVRELRQQAVRTIPRIEAIASN
jgi:hypothetical protein